MPRDERTPPGATPEEPTIEALAAAGGDEDLLNPPADPADDLDAGTPPPNDVADYERLRQSHPEWFQAAPAPQPQALAPEPADDIVIDWEDPDGVAKAIRQARELGSQDAIRAMAPIVTESTVKTNLRSKGIADDVIDTVVERLRSLPPGQLPAAIQNGVPEHFADAEIGRRYREGKLPQPQSPRAPAPRQDPVGGGSRPLGRAFTSSAQSALQAFEAQTGLTLTRDERIEYMRQFDGGY